MFNAVISLLACIIIMTIIIIIIVIIIAIIIIISSSSSSSLNVSLILSGVCLMATAPPWAVALAVAGAVAVVLGAEEPRPLARRAAAQRPHIL